MSTLKADTIVASDGSSPVTLTKQSAAKAWGYSNSGAAPVSSFNVASVTDNSTGNYSFNYTNSMSDANYQVSAAATGGNKVNGTSTTNTSSYVVIFVRDLGSNTLVDNYASPAVHGDLA